MAHSLPSIDFRRIRPHGKPPSQAGGFEELVSMLIEQLEDWPEGTKFRRFGGNDGGREGQGHLPNGDVWAWQAKYKESFDPSIAGKIKNSFLRTISREPNLKRYFVAMPLDLSAGDNASTTSASTRWNSYVEQWKQLAEDQGIQVSIEFFGEHEILNILTLERNIGRLRYWFDEHSFALSTQKRIVRALVDKVGPRYHAELHVEVEAARALEALGRTSEYADFWRDPLAALRSEIRYAWVAPDENRVAYEHAIENCLCALSQADTAIQKVIDSIPQAIEITNPEHTINRALDKLESLLSLLHEHSLIDRSYFVDKAAMLHSNVRNSQAALYTAIELANSPYLRIANHGELLLTGRAGMGKTHALCDIALKRTSNEQPTLLLMGQDFGEQELISQIPAQSGFNGSTLELLQALDAAGEAQGTRALIIIDAANESPLPHRWEQAFRMLRSMAQGCPNIGLVISCRTELVESVIGQDDIPSVQHHGLEVNTATAVQRFANAFGLETPTFPLLNSELNNPLFLLLTCKTLSALGKTRFETGTAGLTEVFESLVRQTNKTLAHPSRCNYDPNLNLVEKAIQSFIRLDKLYFERASVNEITTELLPNSGYSKSLLKGLIDEGILIEIGTDRIGFGYERLGDQFRAKNIASKTLSEIQAWLESNLPEYWNIQGTLGALAALIPEIHHVELIELASSSNSKPQFSSHPELTESFLQSLTERSCTSIRETTKALVVELLTSSDWAAETTFQLLRLACVPGHALNGRWLHNFLGSLSISDRDASWSTFLINALESDKQSPIRILINWAWPLDSKEEIAPDTETATLAVLALGWMLTTPDNRVRDNATKALVSIGEKNLQGFVSAIPLLLTSNDPYVIERIVGTACAISLRSPAPEVSHNIANALDALVKDDGPKHLLIRDYIKRTFARARKTGWAGADLPALNDSQWPIETISREEMETFLEAPDDPYKQIWLSLSKYGDFGRYIVATAVSHLDTPDVEETLDLTRRAIFDRVRNLGPTPELFNRIDIRPRQELRNNPVERFEKKYQWIAFYEVLGLLTANFQIKTSWGTRTSVPYDYPEQVITHPVDITVLERPADTGTENRWFSPVQAIFPRAVTSEYPTDMDGIPDPIELIKVNDPSGTEWLSLHSHVSWEQKFTPDIAATQPPKRYAWMIVQSYLLPIDQSAEIMKWAANKDWSGRWMPEPPEITNALLGSYPDDPQWDIGLNWDEILAEENSSREEAEPSDEQKSQLEQLLSDLGYDGILSETPTSTYKNRTNQVFPGLINTSCIYGGTGWDRDFSSDQETTGYIPSPKLLSILGLTHGVDFCWSDSAGAAVFDPSTKLAGPKTLLVRRDLIPKLANLGFTVFWTVLSEHELFPSQPGNIGNNYKFVSASASYLLNDGKIEMIASHANQHSRDSQKPQHVNWKIRDTEE